jgi:hypothetical protein
MPEFARRVKGLHRLFPSSGVKQIEPREIREEVNLVHEFPGRAVSFEKIGTGVFVAGAAATPSGDLVIAGPEEWLEVIHADTFHDSATARRILIRLVLSPTNFSLEVARFEALVSSVAFGEPWFSQPVGTTLRVLPSRPFYIPPGAKLTQAGDTAGVAYSITTTMAFVRHELPETPLYVG